MDIAVEIVGGSRALVTFSYEGRSWSSEFDLLTGDVDELARRLDKAMSRDMDGQTDVELLLRRRLLEARLKLGGDSVGED